MEEELNNTVWATLKPSEIHGIGVFAIRDIPNGQKINLQGGPKKWISADLTKVIPEVRKLIQQRWPMERDGHQFISPNDDARLISFTNHSDTPNYDKYSDFTLKEIKEGEEITEDYGDYKDIINIP